jgi:hypothetical protein
MKLHFKKLKINRNDPITCAHLYIRKGSLFCFVLFCSYEIHRIKMLQIMFLVSLESSRQAKGHGLGSMKSGFAVQKFLNIE